MGELSIEEKAKRYDEAIKRAKAMIKVVANQDESIGFANTIFPELKESEDEKIRKELIQYIKNWKANIQGKAYPYLWSSDNEECNKLLAWLEKQGEQTINQPDFEIPFGAIDSELIEESYYIPKGYHAEISKDKVTIKKGEQKPLDYENANIQQKDFAPKASFADRQVYNRAILKILSDYIEKYPDVRFVEMLCNLGFYLDYMEESQITYLDLNKIINKQNHE